MVKQVVPEVVELKIQFNQRSGQTQIMGPIENRTLCYAMLETAKEIILMRALGAPKPSNLVIPQLHIRGNGPK